MSQVRRPSYHMVELDVGPGSWLQPGPDPAIEATWVLNQQLIDFSVSPHAANPYSQIFLPS